jgi:hypothetical protein
MSVGDSSSSPVGEVGLGEVKVLVAEGELPSGQSKSLKNSLESRFDVKVPPSGEIAALE